MRRRHGLELPTRRWSAWTNFNIEEERITVLAVHRGLPLNGTRCWSSEVRHHCPTKQGALLSKLEPQSRFKALRSSTPSGPITTRRMF